ncbi:hypothetical protein PGT21_010073 [Puccinia graminis f. sp. tritici]|uniref:Uncharacterized protein n=1 Tax=Puccinia graminis f. sp. tritici TaxID=56615 RepID=A0A5B0PT44_PUCGR|nr:hypothetical protein PGT21_010073 [Puccinia graminis f. sp. tritici]
MFYSRLRGRIKPAIGPYDLPSFSRLGDDILCISASIMSSSVPDSAAMVVDSPTRDTIAPHDTSYTSPETTTLFNPSMYTYSTRREDQIETDETHAASSAPRSLAVPSTPIHADPEYAPHGGARMEEGTPVGPLSSLSSNANPTNQASHAYPTRQEAQIEEDEVPSYPPPPAASPDDSPAPPADPPATPHPRPTVDPYYMDARFSAQFLAMSFYNTLLSVHDVLGELTTDHSHFLRHEIMRSATILAEDWFNYHRLHLPDQFAEPHSMGHLVASSVRFTVRCLNALILEYPDLYRSFSPLSQTD